MNTCKDCKQSIYESGEEYWCKVRARVVDGRELAGGCFDDGEDTESEEAPMNNR